MSSPGEWYHSLPPVCKFWGTACVLTTIGVQLGVVDPRVIYLDYPLVFKKFQVSMLIQHCSINVNENLYILYRNPPHSD